MSKWKKYQKLEEVPNNKGLYAVCGYLTDEILYIGNSTVMQNRLKIHLASKKFNNEFGVYFKCKIMEVKYDDSVDCNDEYWNMEELRDVMEQRLIRRIKPKYNKNLYSGNICKSSEYNKNKLPQMKANVIVNRHGKYRRNTLFKIEWTRFINQALIYHSYEDAIKEIKRLEMDRSNIRKIIIKEINHEEQNAKI